MKITHAMANRLAIGHALAKLEAPATPRDLGAATGLDLTSITTALSEMQMMRPALVERVRITPEQHVVPSGGAMYAYRLTEFGRGAHEPKPVL